MSDGINTIFCKSSKQKTQAVNYAYVMDEVLCAFRRVLNMAHAEGGIESFKVLKQRGKSPERERKVTINVPQREDMIFWEQLNKKDMSVVINIQIADNGAIGVQVAESTNPKAMKRDFLLGSIQHFKAVGDESFQKLLSNIPVLLKDWKSRSEMHVSRQRGVRYKQLPLFIKQP